jgi:hypothetical protein
VTAQRLSRIAAGLAIVTALGVTALVTRNVLWPDDPDASLQRNGGKVMGDITGYVGRVDRKARTVDISSSPLGIRPVVLVVTNETAIVVNGKQGAIGDLWKDLPVKVYYEVRGNARYATSIQVTAGDSLAAFPVTKDEATAAPASPPAADRPAAAVSTKETKAPSVATSPTLVTSPAPPMVPVSVATKPTPVAQPPAAVAQPPAPRVEEPAVARGPATATTSASSAESASVGSSRAARPAPAEPDADASAAIDWLLKGAGRR